MTKGGFSIKPSRKQEDPLFNQKLEQFAMGAEKKPEEVLVSPWNEGVEKKEGFKVFPLRLTAEDYNKLNYISKTERLSKNQICLDILLPALDKKLGTNQPSVAHDNDRKKRIEVTDNGITQPVGEYGVSITDFLLRKIAIDSGEFTALDKKLDNK